MQCRATGIFVLKQEWTIISANRSDLTNSSRFSNDANRSVAAKERAKNPCRLLLPTVASAGDDGCCIGFFERAQAPPRPLTRSWQLASPRIPRGIAGHCDSPSPVAATDSARLLLELWRGVLRWPANSASRLPLDSSSVIVGPPHPHETEYPTDRWLQKPSMLIRAFMAASSAMSRFKVSLSAASSRRLKAFSKRYIL